MKGHSTLEIGGRVVEGLYLYKGATSMKYTIEGFNQKYAMTLRKEVEIKGKKVVKKVDCTDLVILRWYVDFYPKMKKVMVKGEQYAWVYYQKLMDDLPLIDISRRAFAERLQKLVDFGILTYEIVYDIEGTAGTYTLYGFGENYIKLIDDSVEGCGSNDIGGCSSNSRGGEEQTSTKDISINNTSIKKIKEIEYDKKDKRQKPNYLTQMLIDYGYLTENEVFIDMYNYMLDDLEESYGFEVIRSCIWYLCQNTKDKEIGNKYAYCKTSLETGATRISGIKYNIPDGAFEWLR